MRSKKGGTIYIRSPARHSQGGELHWRNMAHDTFPGLSLALMKKAHSQEEQKNGCRLRIGSLLVSVLFRVIKASFNASFKWNVFLENVYVV